MTLYSTHKTFHSQKNASENIVCKIASVMSRGDELIRMVLHFFNECCYFDQQINISEWTLPTCKQDWVNKLDETCLEQMCLHDIGTNLRYGNLKLKLIVPLWCIYASVNFSACLAPSHHQNHVDLLSIGLLLTKFREIKSKYKNVHSSKCNQK